jgi:signal transduction histidine kinase
MFTLLVILAVFLQIAIAVGVYFRRKGGHTNIIFMFLSLALASWAFTNYIAITITQNSSTIYAIRTVLSLAVIENALFYFFATTFPDKKINVQSWSVKAMLVYTFFVVALTQLPFLFKSVTIKNSTANPNPGPVIIFFVIHAILTISVGLRQLYVKYRDVQGQQKRQLLFIIFASIVLWLIVPVTNFAITLSARTTLFVKFSPFYTLVFGAFITYAIVAQRLFDIRAAVARSVAYVMIIATTALIYGVVLFGIVNVIFQGQQNESLRQVLSVALVAPLAISFQRIKEFFDRISRKLFYRDAYDSPVVLNELGNAIVAEIDLGRILNSTRHILADTLKSSFVDFILFKNNQPFFESSKSSSIQQNFNELNNHMHSQHKDILVADELVPSGILKKLFSEDEIAISLRLKTHQQIVGYILFGNKKSGDIYTSQDEALLTIVANELAITVQNALRFEEIENFNITLQGKVDDATHKLRQTNEKLKALDETKDEFISMASHQLRTPLTSVKGYISMVQEGDAGKITAQQKKLLDQAFVSSQRMVYLIADLLNVSRLKTGKFVIEAQPTQLAEVVQGELQQLVETAKGRSITLVYNKPHDFPVLMLDETKIRQVIMNFADNAIYYTPAGGTITIDLKEVGESIELTVHDTGIGVPKSAQHHLFTKFYRADNAQRARPDGTGLGLFMAKKVIVAQGGAVIFRSQEGKGSTFGFTFPKGKLKVPDHIKPEAIKAKA